MKKMLIAAFGTMVILSSAFVAEAQQTSSTQKCANDSSRECVALQNPLQNKNTDVPSLIGILIKGALGIMGAVTLLMLVWGGFQWLTSAGNAEKVQQGTQTMLWAVIGVAVVLSSYIVLSTLTKYLTAPK